MVTCKDFFFEKRGGPSQEGVGRQLYLGWRFGHIHYIYQIFADLLISDHVGNIVYWANRDSAQGHLFTGL